MSSITLRGGAWVLLEGPARVIIGRGAVDVLGVKLRQGEQWEVPAFGRFPLRADGDTKLEWPEDVSPGIVRPDHPPIPESWQDLASTVIEQVPSSVIVLGGTSTGKTTLVHYLANGLSSQSSGACVMDCDVGQSSIGPPGTQGLQPVHRPVIRLEDGGESELYFVGTSSPGRAIDVFVEGVRTLHSRSRRCEGPLIVDTTGWIEGEAARRLKRRELEILNPDLVIALESDRELESIVSDCSERSVRRIPAAPGARNRTSSHRRQYREHRMKRYLRSGESRTLRLHDTALERTAYRSGEPVRIDAPEVIYAEYVESDRTLFVVTRTHPSPSTRETLQEWGQVIMIPPEKDRGRVVGFADEEGLCRGLGIVESIEYREAHITVFTPVTNPGSFPVIQFGLLWYGRDGREISPGENLPSHRSIDEERP